MTPRVDAEGLRGLIAQQERAIELVNQKRAALEKKVQAQYGLIQELGAEFGDTSSDAPPKSLTALLTAFCALDRAEIAILDASQATAQVQLDEMRRALERVESPIIGAMLRGPIGRG